MVIKGPQLETLDVDVDASKHVTGSDPNASDSTGPELSYRKAASVKQPCRCEGAPISSILPST